MFYIMQTERKQMFKGVYYYFTYYFRWTRNAGGMHRL